MVPVESRFCFVAFGFGFYLFANVAHALRTSASERFNVGQCKGANVPPFRIFEIFFRVRKKPKVAHPTARLMGNPTVQLLESYLIAIKSLSAIEFYLIFDTSHFV